MSAADEMKWVKVMNRVLKELIVTSVRERTSITYDIGDEGVTKYIKSHGWGKLSYDEYGCRKRYCDIVMYKQERKEEMAEEFLLKGSPAKLLAAFTLDDGTDWKVALVWRRVGSNSKRKMFDIEVHPDILFVNDNDDDEDSYSSHFSIPRGKITKTWNDEHCVWVISRWDFRVLKSGEICM
jgi:hypothetical protein